MVELEVPSMTKAVLGQDVLPCAVQMIEEVASYFALLRGWLCPLELRKHPTRHLSRRLVDFSALRGFTDNGYL